MQKQRQHKSFPDIRISIMESLKLPGRKKTLFQYGPLSAQVAVQYLLTDLSCHSEHGNYRFIRSYYVFEL